MNYGKLWRMCVEKDISPTFLFAQLKLSKQTLFSMRHNETVSLKTIDKICAYFQCQPNEIMSLEDIND